MDLPVILFVPRKKKQIEIIKKKTNTFYIIIFKKKIQSLTVS